jgi:ribosomal protein S18 acetylase RimI-like enzyme
VSLSFRRLVSSDEAAVRHWLQSYLEEHVAWWLEARGLPGDPAAVVQARGLVDRDWDELLVARAADFVLVAESDGQPVGIVRAALRTDHQVHARAGVLQWLAVDPQARGQGIGRALIAQVTAWFDAHGVSSEVFVTDANAAAVRAYEAAGFRAVDTRMIRPQARQDGPPAVNTEPVLGR